MVGSWYRNELYRRLSTPSSLEAKICRVRVKRSIMNEAHAKAQRQSKTIPLFEAWALRKRKWTGARGQASSKSKKLKVTLRPEDGMEIAGDPLMMDMIGELH